MFIFWGTRHRERPIGYVADFCPICRGLRAFRLVAISRVGHVYGLALGQGQVVAHHKICNDCGIRLEANHVEFAGTAPSVPTSLDQLIAETYPNIYEAYQSRLMVEERVKRDPATFCSRDRMTLIREPFDLVAPLLESGSFGGMGIDFRSGVAAFFAVGVPLLMSILVAKIPFFSRLHDCVAVLALLSAIAGVVAVIYVRVTASRRYVQSRILPLLCRALKPLQPSADEIDSALGGLDPSCRKLLKNLKVQSIMDALAHYRESPSTVFAGSTEAVFPSPPRDRGDESQRAADTSVSNERIKLIRRPFDIAAQLLEAKFSGGTHIDAWTATAMVMTVGVPVAIWAMASDSAPFSKLHQYISPAMWISFIGGVAATVYFMSTTSDRFVRRRLLPTLCSDLFHLNPRAEEVDFVVRSLDSMDFRLGNDLSTQMVMEALEAYRISASSTAEGAPTPISPNSPGFNRWKWPWQDPMKRDKFLVIAAMALIAMVAVIYFSSHG